MSICMPLGDNGHRQESGVVTQLRPDSCRNRKAEVFTDERIDHLEARLERLESEHLTALDLVRRALETLREAQADQNAVQTHAISHLSSQLRECESALSRLDATQRHDDEAMRERLFDMSEILESVRATAAAAVRPAALRKLELALGREMDERAEALRIELGDQVTERVEAAESRSANALDALEDMFWDDMTELARRFDYLADSFQDARRTADDTASCIPTGSDSEEMFDPFPEGEFDSPEDPEELRQAEVPTGVIAFPPRTCRQVEAEEADSPDDIGAVMAATARRSGTTETVAINDGSDGRASRALDPFRRLVTGASSAVVAVCIMSGLSLLAGPALGPGLQGATPAFARDRTEWVPVMVTPEPIEVAPRLRPILQPTGKSHPGGKVNAANSDR